MTARRPTIVFASLVAGLVLALLAGLLLVSGLREGRAPGSRPARPAGTAPERKALPRPPATAPPAEAERPLPGSAVAPVEDSPGTFRLAGSARFEDGSPLPGVHFLDMVRGDDGEPEVVIEPCPIVRVESGADGAFTLGWPARPGAILLLVMSREAEIASVANGALVGPHAQGSVVAATGEGPLALTMRWRPGSGFVRGKDAATGEVRTWWRKEGDEEHRGAKFSMRWSLPDGATEGVRGPSVADNPEGWIPFLPPGVTPGPEDPGPGPVFELVVEGYATARVPFGEMRGRVEVALQPLVPDLVGTVVVPGAGDQQDSLGWSLIPAGGGDAETPDLRGAIAGPGPFALTGVPDGRWILEIWADTAAGMRWARRAFERTGATVDLGAVEVSSWSGFRARAVDADGRSLGVPVAATPIRESQRSDAGGIRVGFSRVRLVQRGSTVTIVGGKWPLHGVQPPDPDGWVEIRDLAPGALYRVALPALPGAGVEAVAPETSGDLRTVEIKVTQRPVRCALRFTVDGAAPEEWGGILGGVVPQDAWKWNGTLEGILFPGKYPVAILARRAGETWKIFRADIVVPDRESWEATVDLR